MLFSIAKENDRSFGFTLFRMHPEVPFYQRTIKQGYHKDPSTLDRYHRRYVGELPEETTSIR